MKALKYLAFFVGIGVALRTFGFVVFGRTISIGLISSALYFIVLLSVYSNLGVKLNKVSLLYGTQIWLPLLYTLILTTANIIYSSISNTELFPLSYFLCFILFLALLYHSLIDPQGPTYPLHGFLLGTIILAVCFYLNIGVDQLQYGRGGLEDRFSVFGVNCNELGLYCSLGILVLLNDFILKKKTRIFHMALLVFVAFLLLSMVFATASRSAFISLVLGIVLIVLFYPTKRKSSKVLALLVGFIVLMVIAIILYNSDLYLIARLYEAAETGDSSNRMEIVSTYYPYIWEHPLFGVGDAGLIEVSRNAFGYADVDDYGKVSALSPHNVLLECALTTGLMGLIIMIVFWCHCARRAYNQYKYFKHSTPIVLLSCILISIFFGHILTDKFGWLVYAYMIGRKIPKKYVRSLLITPQ